MINFWFEDDDEEDDLYSFL